MDTFSISSLIIVALAALVLVTLRDVIKIVPQSEISDAPMDSWQTPLLIAVLLAIASFVAVFAARKLFGKRTDQHKLEQDDINRY